MNRIFFFEVSLRHLRRLGRRNCFVVACLAFANCNIVPLSARTFPQPLESSEHLYLFSYFKNNGADGLHLAYSLDGLKWTALNGNKPLLAPTVGKDRLMRDPQLSLGPDGLFHLVWTTSWTDPAIGHATSKDLIHWSAEEAIRPMDEEVGVRNVWAPELFYDAATRLFILYWASTIPGRFPATDQSGDNGLNHRIYYTSTRDFRTFSRAQILFNPGFNVIDATIVRNATPYLMFYKDETKNPVPKKNLRIAQARAAAGPYLATSGVITGDYWAEGPTVLKLSNAWVVYFDKYRDHKYGAVRSNDLVNWTDISDSVEFPAGARHGSALEVSPKMLPSLLAMNGG